MPIDVAQLETWEGVKLSRSNPMIAKIIAATFPAYNGRKIKMRSWKGPRELHSYWDEGSRDYYALIDTQTGKIGHMESNHPFFEAYKGLNGKWDLPPLHLLIQHSIFAGKDTGITIYVRPSDAHAVSQSVDNS